MKIKRRKNAKRILQVYKSSFGFSEPFSVLIDGTFAKTALDNKVKIEEQVKNYFGSNITLLTTKCVLNELFIMGKELYGAYVICKNMKLYECGHNGSKMARGCLKHIIEKGNEDKLIFATKDEKVSTYAKSKPDVPLVYIVSNTIVLDKPSDVTTEQAKINAAQTTDLTTNEQKVLKKIRAEEREINPVQNKHKKPKAPNPLSCKKSTKNIKAKESLDKIEKVEAVTKVKKRRKRVKVASHASEIVKEKMAILLS